MIIKTYTIPGEPYMDYEPYTTIQHVFIFICDPYQETNKRHQYQKRRRAWALGSNGYCLRRGKRRTRQIERWCKLSRFQCEVSTQ